jgi:predicted HNH restriction endonuclease
MQETSQIIQNKSEINYSYITIKATQSRIDKGLIAIPVSLTKWFPDHADTIQVYLDDSTILQTKKYSSYNSTTRECRIYGMKEWFEKNEIKNGDEIVIQIVDKDNFAYRLIPESNFIIKTQQIQNKFDNSTNEQEALQNLIEIGNWTKAAEEIVKLREFHRLIKETNIEERKRIIRRELSTKDNAPPNIKILLGKIYAGHCQVCDFWFLKKDKNPYFETHHINPEKANYIQNLLLICGNCHNQFHYADVKQELKEGWISRVFFNDRVFEVNQIVFKQKFEEATKEIFI